MSAPGNGRGCACRTLARARAELDDRGDADRDDHRAHRRRGEAPPDARPELPAERRAEREQERGPPLDVSEGDEHDSRDEVREPREDVLEAVDPLHALREPEPECREDDDPLRGAEVAAVDAGREEPRRDLATAVARP